MNVLVVFTWEITLSLYTCVYLIDCIYFMYNLIIEF